MRVGALIAGLLLASVSSPVAGAEPCQDGHVLFEDQFDALDAGWGQSSDVMRVEDGRARISPPPSGYLFLWNNAVLGADVRLCAALTTVASVTPNETVVGLMFWGADKENFHLFEISPNGTAGFFRMENGRPIPLARWQPFAAVKAGDGAVNVIRIDMNGSKAGIFVNDEKFAETEGRPPADRQLIGLAVSSPSTGEAVYTFDFVKAVSN